MHQREGIPGVQVDARSQLLRAAFCLAVTLVGIKGCYLAFVSADRPDDVWHFTQALSAISYLDVCFAVALWGAARATLMLVGSEGRAALTIARGFALVSTLACLYVAVNVVLFHVLGGFLTFQLIGFVGDIGMLRSSVTAQLQSPAVWAAAGAPFFYIAAWWVSGRGMLALRPLAARRHSVAAAAAAAVWILAGSQAFAGAWATKQDRRIAETAPWVFAASLWDAMAGASTANLRDPIVPGDLLDFLPVGAREAAPPVHRASSVRLGRRAATERPPNVILIVLESVGARWTSLTNTLYDTTPVLTAEASHGIVFPNFYAHIGRSSNALAALLLSSYPKLDFRGITDEFPRLPGTSLAAMFRDRGYRTGFITPSDLAWDGWDTFLQGRGFNTVTDYHAMPCSEPISSWGVEDRCMVDEMLRWIGQQGERPFFLMAWSQQTHHPYEPSPATPQLTFRREPVPDQYDLDRYLNVLRDTDHHLGELFAAIRRAGLEDHTLVVVTGDHGQAFGYPHDSYMQGRTVYEEDVHVPLLFWFPRAYRTPGLSKTIGGHVDIAPTIADVLHWESAPDWQGRSLLDPGHAPRAYFYVAEHEYRLGVREGDWKYIVDLRDGTEELFDLAHDPTEQRNVARADALRSKRLRQRVAAWMEANRQQYEAIAARASN